METRMIPIAPFGGTCGFWRKGTAGPGLGGYVAFVAFDTVPRTWKIARHGVCASRVTFRRVRECQRAAERRGPAAGRHGLAYPSARYPVRTANPRHSPLSLT